MTKPIKTKVWKRDEFREFIKTLKEGQFKYWYVVAESVGVSPETIVYWKQLPEAQNAMAIGIVNALENMETAGKKDWRMWHETAKTLMNGLNPAQKHEVKLTDTRKAILARYGLGEQDVRQTQEIEGGSSENTA